MECPKCKNPINNNNSPLCEWCGSQLPIEAEHWSKRLKRFITKLYTVLISNKKRLYIILSSVLILLLFYFVANLIVLNWYGSRAYQSSKEKYGHTKFKIVEPQTWQEKSAFDYLTKVRNLLLKNPDSFEQKALIFSQDSIPISHKGRFVNYGELYYTFDKIANKLEVGEISPIFEIRNSNYDAQYGLMKLLKKGDGYYKVQYIIRNVTLEIGQYFQGGIIIQLDENKEHGLIAATKDCHENTTNFESAKRYCAELELNGFNDWRLPNEHEISLLYKSKYILSGIHYNIYYGGNDYWGTKYENDSVPIYLEFRDGQSWRQTNENSFYRYVRAVRTF
jgi:hypothetical protein